MMTRLVVDKISKFTCVEFETLPSIMPHDTFIIPPKTTSILITIAPYHPPVSSQQQTSIPLYTPMFTDSTVPPTTTTIPLVSVNVSNTGAKPSSFSTHVSHLVSPHNRDDRDMIFDDAEDEDLGGFTYSPFQIQTESEAIESILDIITKEHSANAAKMNKGVADSAEVCKTTTKKFDKPITDTTTIMENFQTTFNSNTPTTNEALKSLGSLFKYEKTKLQEIHTGLKTDHEAFQTSISSQISKLQDESAKESDITHSLFPQDERSKGVMYETRSFRETSR
ncbi:unnamed protein product [Lactuca saligna]|uniref:Uncharacterized protein n=1 Tax=Lactuca saligna TaxID=75948 RepID=A0AA35Y9U1_LACSI|nr:unnamed protein product [Lactuca saligna]